MSKAERLYAQDQRRKAFIQTLYTARELIFLQKAIEYDIYLIFDKECSGMEFLIEQDPERVILTLPLSDIRDCSDFLLTIKRLTTGSVFS